MDFETTIDTVASVSVRAYLVARRLNPIRNFILKKKHAYSAFWKNILSSYDLREKLTNYWRLFLSEKLENFK